MQARANDHCEKEQWKDEEGWKASSGVEKESVEMLLSEALIILVSLGQPNTPSNRLNGSTPAFKRCFNFRTLLFS